MSKPISVEQVYFVTPSGSVGAGYSAPTIPDTLPADSSWVLTGDPGASATVNEIELRGSVAATCTFPNTDEEQAAGGAAGIELGRFATYGYSIGVDGEAEIPAAGPASALFFDPWATPEPAFIATYGADATATPMMTRVTKFPTPPPTGPGNTTYLWPVWIKLPHSKFQAAITIEGRPYGAGVVWPANGSGAPVAPDPRIGPTTQAIWQYIGSNSYPVSVPFQVVMSTNPATPGGWFVCQMDGLATDGQYNIFIADWDHPGFGPWNTT